MAITSTVTATKVAGSLFGSVPAANMPKYFPGRVAIATSREIFAPILWRVSHNQHFLRGTPRSDSTRHQRSSSGCTHLYGVISRCSVNLIMRTGRVPHERQRNEDSSFQIGVIRAHDPAAPDHFTFLGAHRWPLERPWRGSVLGKERTRDAIGTAVCEPLFDHSKSRSHLRALPSDEPLRRQPASDAGRVSRLSRARCAERRHRARISLTAS